MKKEQLLSPETLESVLFGCNLLCTAGPVSLVAFIEIYSPDSPHDKVVNLIESLTLQGNIKYYVGIIYSINSDMCDYTFTNDILIRDILSRLIQKTTIHLYDDRLAVSNYFIMGDSFIRYVIESKPNIDFSLFAKLICNFADNSIVWYNTKNSATQTDELPIMRAMEMAINELSEESVVSRLHAYCAMIYSNAWAYEKAWDHIQKCDVNTGYACLAKAHYYWNYGRLAPCIEQLVMATNINDNQQTTANASLMVALVLALIGEYDSCQAWLDEKCKFIHFLPCTHELFVVSQMLHAMFADNLEQAMQYLDQCELILNRLNPEAPISCLLHYMRSQIWSMYNFPLRSLEEYKQYVVTSIETYKSASTSDGGWAILMSSRIEYELIRGMLCNAKTTSIRELDSIRDLYSDDLSFSARSAICQCYVNLHTKLNLNSLALNYSEIGDTLRKLYQPSKKTLRHISHLFLDGIPSLITMDTACETALEQLQIGISMTEHNQSSKSTNDIRMDIGLLRKKYPNLDYYWKMEEARLENNLKKSVQRWQCIIGSVPEEDLFWVARYAANLAVSYGAIYEAMDMLKQAIYSSTFQKLPSCDKFDVLLEYVMVVEECGFRSIAYTYWSQLETIASTNDEQRSMLYIKRAQTEWAHGQYNVCNLFLSQFFAVYQKFESAPFDELLSLAWHLRSSLDIQTGNYAAAVKATNKSLALLMNTKDFSSFPIHQQKAYAEILLNDFRSARETLGLLKRLACSGKEKNMVGELYEFLERQRIIYFKK